MFNLFKKKQEKDPICGMIANEKFISKYGKRFCSEDCLKKYEDTNQIADSEKFSEGCGGCCRG